MKPRLAKLHSTARARAYVLAGWELRRVFREHAAGEPYEYILEWLRRDEPVHPGELAGAAGAERTADASPALKGLEHIVRALAQAPAVQAALFPVFVAVADELALGLEEALRCSVIDARTATPAQQRLLHDLEAYIRGLSGPPNEDFWLNPQVLAQDARWERIRLLASAVALAFGWPLEAPPPDGATYVARTNVLRNV